MMRCNEIEEENQQLEDRVLLEMTLNISTYPFRGRFLFSEGPKLLPNSRGTITRQTTQRSLHSRWFAIRITNTRLHTARALGARLGLGLMSDISREIHHNPLGLRTRLHDHLVAPLGSEMPGGRNYYYESLFFNYTPYRFPSTSSPLDSQTFSSLSSGKEIRWCRGIDSTKCYIVRFLK